MNSEESRLRTFVNWPENAAVDARRIATAGFYYMCQGLEVQCFSCGGRISEWNIGDCVMSRHRALNPCCPFVQDPVLSGNVPLIADRRNRPNTSQENHSYYQDEKKRLETFSGWPIRDIVTPERLAKSGFYYTLIKDKVRCAYCQGMVEKWEIGDDPDKEHKRYFPQCSFIRNKILSDTSVQNLSGISVRESQVDSIETSFENLKELGVQDHRVPRHGKFATYDSRLNTFSQWPPSLTQKPHDLADAGFYFTGRGDQVRCFHCDGGLRLWEREDDPWLEHAHWFPTCGYLLLIKGQEFVDEAQAMGVQNLNQVPRHNNLKNTENTSLHQTHSVTEQQLQDLMNTPYAITALQMGIEASRVKEALRQRMELVGAPFSTPEALVVAALEVQTEQITSSEGENWITPPNSPTFGQWRRRISPILVRSSSDEEEESEDTEQQECTVEQPRDAEIPPQVIPPPPQENCTSNSPQVNPSLSLEEENRRLKEARLCKVCMDYEVSVVFLPCRHLVTCAHCAHSLPDCPLCRQAIKATVRTFLS